MRLAPLFALAFAAAASAQAPDTLDWHRYYPLAVGNAWEYQDAEMWDVQFRRTLVADTVVGGRTYFVRRTDSAAAVNGPAGPDTLRSTRVDYVRYDETGGGVVAVASLADDGAAFQPCSNDGFERDLRLGFGARRACEPSPGPFFPDAVVVEGQYDTAWTPPGASVPVDVAAIKQFTVGSGIFSTFVADMGPTRTGNLGGPELRYARIGGVEYGTPGFAVGAEPGGPLTPTDALVSLPDDLTFTLANLTSEPVVLDSLVMRFGGEFTFRGWSFSSEGEPSPSFSCSFYNGDPFPGSSGCSTPVTFVPGAVAQMYSFYENCAICRPGNASGGAARDTLLVYSGGNTTPDVVLFDDSGFVGTEEVPAPAGLALSIGPNPSVRRATVTITAAEPVRSVRVVVLDALGRRVAVLHDGALPAGEAQLTVPPGLPAGVYTVRADTGVASATARFTVVR